MTKFLIISFVALIVFTPATGFAQSFGLPQPIQDLMNLGNKISVGQGNSIRINEIIETGSNFSPNDILSKIKNVWDNVNNWMSSHIGVSFSEILKGIGGIIVWALQLIVSLIQKLLSFAR